MSYTLYIRNHCQGCSRILKALAGMGLNMHVINLDEEMNSSGIIIVPALFNGHRLLAYGDDIAAYLSK